MDQKKFGGEGIEELLARLQRQDKLIRDPFSLDKSRGRKQRHATNRYALALMEQVKTVHPDAEQIVKDLLIEFIHPEYRDDFFRNFNQPKLFMNGATYEICSRIANEFAPINDRITYLYTFTRYDRFLIWAGQILGPDIALKGIAKATQNLTSAINLRIVTRTPHDNTYSIEYESTEDYWHHIRHYFGDEAFEGIEKRNFEFTLTMLKLIPVLLGTAGISEEQIVKTSKNEGVVVNTFMQGMRHFVQIRYPEIVPWRKRLFLSSFAKADEALEKAGVAINRLANQAMEDWAVEEEELRRRLAGFVEEKGLNQELLELSAERIEYSPKARKDPGLVATETAATLKRQSQMLQKIEAPGVEVKINMAFENLEQVVELGPRLAGPFEEIASALQDIEKNRQLFQELGKIAVQKVIAEFNSAPNKREYFDYLMKLLDEQDRMVVGHSYRVEALAREMAEKGYLMHRTKTDAELVQVAARYHDLGKLATQRSILLKPDKLTDAEWDFIKKHAQQGAQMLEGMEFEQSIIDGVRHHHEYWDGSRGYPQERSGEEIPEVSRIISIADTFDAIAAEAIDEHRRYQAKKQLGRREWQDAYFEIMRCAESQFDPQLMPVLEAMMQAGFLHNFYAAATVSFKTEQEGWNPMQPPSVH